MQGRIEMAEGEHAAEPIGDDTDASADASMASGTVVDVTETPDDSPVTTSAVAVARRRASRRPAARKAKAKTKTKTKTKVKAEAEAKGRAKVTRPAAAPKKPRAKVKRARKAQTEEAPKQVTAQNKVSPSPAAPAAGGPGLVRLGLADFAVWVDAALSAALTDKDRKRLNKVLKRARKRLKARTG
jgi:hypothetical protein